ncbi:metallophosphoesterase [Nonlabens spongiae]|uniref:Metallophosphoesterase n=1 Tax=Nonlabens spongiae TaxID=331648 RepID=A0A1W6MM20_9FLAO|nr:ligase-associated DNA damage response endonuclease PdeM [Nonlabens spongiae]ARN78640.1 metallophosphoesterase [Nonlabens spongiae]
MSPLEIKIHDQNFVLHPSGACFWEEQDVVLLADVHLGKSAHFRKHGMAVPSTADDVEYDKLNAVIEYFNPDSIWFLGDLFHSYQNAEWHYFEQWVRMQQIEIVLVMGNHDIISRDHFKALGIKTYDILNAGKFYFTHHPQEVAGRFNFSGHIHPAVKLQGVGRQKVKLPCFFQSETGMILPAFGDFTGTYCMTPVKGNKIYAVADDEVVECC